MKKKLRLLLAVGVLGIAVLLSGNSMQTQAATKKSTAATNKYKNFVKSQNKKAYQKCIYKIVDLDKNGIPELILANYHTLNHEVYTYNYQKKKMVTLKKCGQGKWYSANGLGYNTSKKSFRISTASTGGSKIAFYKVKGTSTSKITSFEYRNAKHYGATTYLVNGKKVSEKTYNKKYKVANKGYKDLK